MIALLSALEEEIRDLKRGMSIKKTSNYQNCRVYTGRCGHRDSLLILTGMGQENAKKATQFILEKFPVSALVSTGFGGALNEKTETGDIVVYSKISCEGSRIGSPGEALRCDSNLISAASCSIDGACFRSLVGNGVTVSKVYETPQSKLELGRDFSADVVDMESYWIGQLAANRKVPFLAVRSIFDAVQDDLSLLNHIIIEGRINRLRALGYFVSHPRQLRRTANYSANYRKTRKNLAVFLHKLMKEI